MPKDAETKTMAEVIGERDLQLHYERVAYERDVGLLQEALSHAVMFEYGKFVIFKAKDDDPGHGWMVEKTGGEDDLYLSVDGAWLPGGEWVTRESAEIIGIPLCFPTHNEALIALTKKEADLGS